MSAAYDKGREFESAVASIIRHKIDKGAKRDNKSGSLWTRRSDVFTALPISIECKHHESIKIRDFFRQAKQASSVGQMPAAVFPIDNEIVATVPFKELIDLYVEIDQLRSECDMLREPVHEDIDKLQTQKPITIKASKADYEKLKESEGMARRAETHRAAQGFRTCKNGHLVDSRNRCLQKACPYSSSYKKKKDK